jgi:hypothetical protein
MADVPDEVRRLAAEREERRRRKDFAEADALRDRIEGLGFRVVDAPGGTSLERIETARAAVERVRPADVPSVLELPPRYDVTVQWVVEGWPEDVERGLAAFRRHSGRRSVQHVVADVTGEASTRFEDHEDGSEALEVVSLVEGTGWASARNAGIRRSLGRTLVVVDGSVEPRGDVLGPLERALADPGVGVCGPFGIVTHDLREFETSGGPDVDAIEGYLMAFRREVVARLGGFDERFRWYRTADIEISFRAKDLGLRALVVDVPVERHQHRMWTSASEDERSRWSRRNYNRFLDRFRGRFDLTVAGPPPAGGDGT